MNYSESFAELKILIVGDVMLDRYWWGTVDRISPEAPVPVVKLEKSSSTAGGAAHVAMNVAGLGAKALLVGAVGDDLDADLLFQALSEGGVEPDHLITIDGRPTSVKTRVIAHNQQVVRVDWEYSSEISKDDEEALLRKIEILLPESDAVIVSDYAKGVITPNVISRLADLGKTLNRRIFVDPKGKDYSKYKGVAVITPNRKEAAAACNFDEHLPDLVERSGHKLMSELDLEMLVITEGEHGMTLFEKGKPLVHLDTEAQETYDVTGAGDTVIATLAVAMAAELPFVDAARLANAAAGIAVEQLGTTVVTLSELESAALRGRDAHAQ